MPSIFSLWIPFSLPVKLPIKMLVFSKIKAVNSDSYSTISYFTKPLFPFKYSRFHLLCHTPRNKFKIIIRVCDYCLKSNIGKANLTIPKAEFPVLFINLITFIGDFNVLMEQNNYEGDILVMKNVLHTELWKWSLVFTLYIYSISV